MSTELVPVKQYAVIAKQDVFAEMLEENLGGMGISVRDLDRVKFPSGGATVWMVPTISGEEAMKKIEGVIVYQRNSRVYFERSFEESGGQDKPTCLSENGMQGKGQIADMHGGNCLTCPLAQWESAKKGKGQACAQNKDLYILTKDSLLPIYIKTPPTSTGIVQSFLQKLSGQGIHYSQVVVELTLEKAKSEGNIDYAKLVIKGTKIEDANEAAMMFEAHKKLKPMLSAITVEEGIVVDSEDSGGVTFDEGQPVGGLDLD